MSMYDAPPREQNGCNVHRNRVEGTKDDAHECHGDRIFVETRDKPDRELESRYIQETASKG